jgi:sarcosine oxidase subunit gamma
MASALEQHFAMPQVFAAVSISEVAAIKVWQLEGFASIEAQVAELTKLSVPSAGKFTEASDQRLVWQGKDRYFWLTDVTSIESTPDFYATDQSQGKTQLQVGGADARALLARGIPVELDEQAFAVGDIKMTHINHIGVSIMRLANVDGQPVFELWVMRGFAVSLLEFLTASAATLR